MEISNHVAIRMRYHHQGVIPLLGDPVLETRSLCLAYAFHRGKDIVNWVGAARDSNVVANLTNVLWFLRSTPWGCGCFISVAAPMARLPLLAISPAQLESCIVMLISNKRASMSVRMF